MCLYIDVHHEKFEIAKAQCTLQSLGNVKKQILLMKIRNIEILAIMWHKTPNTNFTKFEV